MSNNTLTKLWKSEYAAKDIQAAEEDFSNGALDGGALSSIYYTVATKKRAEGDQRGYKKYLERATKISDSFIHERSMLGPDEIDVRQSILREAGRADEALSAIEEGLKKAGLATHTKALLLAGEAEALFATQGKKAEKRIKNIMKGVEESVQTIAEESPLQAIRVYRALARYAKRVNNRSGLSRFVRKAQALIDAHGAKDQERKLTFDLKEKSST